MYLIRVDYFQGDDEEGDYDENEDPDFMPQVWNTALKFTFLVDLQNVLTQLPIMSGQSSKHQQASLHGHVPLRRMLLPV